MGVTGAGSEGDGERVHVGEDVPPPHRDINAQTFFGMVAKRACPDHGVPLESRGKGNSAKELASVSETSVGGVGAEGEQASSDEGVAGKV